MNRVSESMVRFMMRERFLDRFEEEVSKGEETTIDVFLKKETEYVVRGRVAKGQGVPTLSILDITGAPVPMLYNDGKCFSMIPEEDGLYRINAALKAAAKGQEPVAIAVTLSCAMALPKHILLESARLSGRSIEPALSKDELTDDWSDLKRAATM